MRAENMRLTAVATATDDASMPEAEPVKKARSPAPVFALLFAGVAGVAGSYAWTQHEQVAAAVARVDLVKQESVACTTELERIRSGAVALADQVTTCEVERATVRNDREALGTDLAAMQADLSATRVEIEDLRKLRAETEKRLAAFRELTTRFQKMIDTGQLKVEIRNGRMVLKLPSEILFASGKADLSRDGELALMEVALILKQFPDRQFVVAGHTDNQPLKGSSYRNNWQLSTERALVVTEFMIEAGMKANRLSAAGYGEFDPVGNNKTDAGRKDNRRIEIVLVPKIEELPAWPADEKPADSAAPKP
jgi:chemotaxis protein MotB